MRTHTVRQGDTLGRLARLYYGVAARYPLIVSANRIADPDRLIVGQQLVIPDLATATQAGSTPGASLGAVPLAGRVLELNERRLQQVHPVLAARGRTMVELCARRGVALLVTQGLRTWAEQDVLYAKGRTAPPLGAKYVVTKAKGGQSWHNFGLAFDVVILDSLGKADWNTAHAGWQIAADVGKSLGLAWGGDWSGFKDLPHYQYTGDLTLAQCRQLFPSGLPAVWQRVI